jgi:hypothetical protein
MTMKASLIKIVAVVSFVGAIYSGCSTASTLRVVLDQNRTDTSFRRGAIAMNKALSSQKIGMVFFSSILLAAALFQRKSGDKRMED